VRRQTASTGGLDREPGVVDDPRVGIVMRHQRLTTIAYAAVVFWLLAPVARCLATEDEGCFECHGSSQQIADAAQAMDLKLTTERLAALVVVAPVAANVHKDLGCLTCHEQAREIPHPTGLLKGNLCASCHEDALKQVNASIHRDDAGGSETKAPCWACHTAHNVLPATNPDSPMHPRNVAGRCLQCHDKGEYLTGVHGYGVQRAGLDFAATCVSCHGSHNIQSSREVGSRVKRRNVSVTCGECHSRVSQAYERSVHGAALREKDNPDVPTCVDCHEPHGTLDPQLVKWRLQSPRMCGKCHDDKAMMGKYGLSTDVFSTYIADFHGTTAELFRTTSPDQPLNQAVCYDCHGYHDVESVRASGHDNVQRRLLVRCQACHPKATVAFLSAWAGHYTPSPRKFPIIYWVKEFYRWVIPGTVGFFLLYIAVDVVGRIRQRRRS